MHACRLTPARPVAAGHGHPVDRGTVEARIAFEQPRIGIAATSYARMRARCLPWPRMGVRMAVQMGAGFMRESCDIRYLTPQGFLRVNPRPEIRNGPFSRSGARRSPRPPSPTRLPRSKAGQ